MNPTEIADALDALAQEPFAPETFGLSFAEATDNPQATLAKLRNGSIGKSDVPGGMLLSRKFHYAPAEVGQVEAVLAQLRASKKNKTGKPAILLATDGQTIAAEHPKSGAPLHCAFSELGAKFSFFLPAAGKERYQAAEENSVDVRATGKLARLYDALLKANPDWRAEERRHDMNLFMTRLIFCLFAEDVGVFPESQFSSVLFDYSGDRGEHARETLIHAFTAMNLPEGERSGLPVWAGALKYVNGGLFAGAIDAPVFDVISFRYLRDASGMDWKLINPDIFGSMIQSIADEKARSELGMHYTSVPNIMKVLGPLFLDDLDAEIEKAWDKPAALRAQLARLSKIRVFDPACGSGNFHAWTEHEIEAFELKWPVGTNERLGFDLLLYTAQRSGDVRQMTVHQILDGRVLVRQEKTGQLVDIPQHPNLQASLAARKIEHLALLTTRQGKPFTEKGFGNWVSKAAERAGLPHCSAHGLRKAAARRLAEAGCTAHEIMSITGHQSLKEVERYTREVARRGLADTAMNRIA
ncbi:type IIL restriction-modification enzyme MmeI [Brevundimonas diminuta]|uniref:type IIL restriction-modification enzyme MmeI n=1 Tax=Brevundimonas diminuta TaxID=293 RepID=UPI0006281C80|nr:type IIL restriction-modification enzyme MmeI [Brevundimonas diminuta]